MNRTRSRLGGLAAVFALVGALLAGCGGNDDADPQPSFSPAPSDTTTTSSPVGTSTSATPVQETAEEFVRRWNAESTTMQNTGRSTAFVSLNSPDCEACNKLVATVKSYYGHGGFVRAKPWTHVAVTERPGGNENAGVYDVRFVAARTAFRPSADEPVQHTTGGSNALAMTLQHQGDGWLVLDYVVATS